MVSLSIAEVSVDEKSGVSKGGSYFKNHVDSFVWVSWYLTHVVFQIGDGVFENGAS